MAAPARIVPVEALQEALTGLCSAPVVVERQERLDPWAVARVWLRGASALARSVVVKSIPPGQREARSAAWRLHTERAALQFLREDIGIDLAPRVLAVSPAAGFLVLEDLAPGWPWISCFDATEQQRMATGWPPSPVPAVR